MVSRWWSLLPGTITASLIILGLSVLLTMMTATLSGPMTCKLALDLFSQLIVDQPRLGLTTGGLTYPNPSSLHIRIKTPLSISISAVIKSSTGTGEHWEPSTAMPQTLQQVGRRIMQAGTTSWVGLMAGKHYQMKSTSSHS